MKIRIATVCRIVAICSIGELALNTQAGWFDAVVSPPQSKEFKSIEGGFTLKAPCTLKETVESLDTAYGKTVSHSFQGVQGAYQYAVAYNDYQETFMNQNVRTRDDADNVLLGACAGMVRGVKGRILSTFNVVLTKYTVDARYPGKEITITGTTQSQSFVIKARFYLVGKRLYTITISCPKGKEDSTLTADFMNSFHLTE